jgi:hypothetical protein
VGRLSWIAGRQAVPMLMSKPLSSLDDMAEDVGSRPVPRRGRPPPKMRFAPEWVGEDDVPAERRYRSRINWVGVCGKDVPAGRLGKGVGSHVLKAWEILNDELFTGT